MTLSDENHELKLILYSARVDFFLFRALWKKVKLCQKVLLCFCSKTFLMGIT